MRDQNYALNVSEQQLQQMPRLPRTDLPAQVSPDQLRQLYANFNVTPYWERAAQFAERPGAGRHSIAATVQEIDQQQGTVTLQTTRGKTIDLQVPSDMLSNL